MEQGGRGGEGEMVERSWRTAATAEDEWLHLVLSHQEQWLQPGPLPDSALSGIGVGPARVQGPQTEPLVCGGVCFGSLATVGGKLLSFRHIWADEVWTVSSALWHRSLSWSHVVTLTTERQDQKLLVVVITSRQSCVCACVCVCDSLPFADTHSSECVCCFPLFSV